MEKENEETRKKRAAGVYGKRNLTPEQLKMLTPVEVQRYNFYGYLQDPAKDSRAPETTKNSVGFMLVTFVCAVLAFVSWFALTSQTVDYIAGSFMFTLVCTIVTTIVTTGLLIYLIKNTKRSQ